MVQHTESPRSDADDDFEDPFRRLRLTNGIEHEGTSNLVRSQIVSVLPGQCHSLQDKILKLTFSRTDVDEAGSAQDLSIILSVDASPGCGGVVWPAGQILSNYLFTKGSTYLRGKNVLELGSGTGLVGLFASLLGPNHVWITDQAPLLGIMRHNISMNNLDSKCTVVGLDWGMPLPASLPHPDLILAADCVYFEPAFPLLVQTLCDLVQDTTEVLFCYKKRRKADKRFFTLLRKKFDWTQVSDDPNRSIYERDSIDLLRISKRKTRTSEQRRLREEFDSCANNINITGWTVDDDTVYPFSD